jgi:hypothetical protein
MGDFSGTLFGERSLVIHKSERIDADRPVLKRRNRYRYLLINKKKNGRTYYYFRYPGRSLVPLPGPIGSMEFAQTYRKAVANTDLSKEIKAVALEIAEWNEPPLIGVYLLLLAGEVVYVGSSVTMPARVANHRTNGRAFDQVFYIPTKARDRGNLERVLIQAINPIQNRVGKKRAHSPAIGAELAGDHRTKSREMPS